MNKVSKIIFPNKPHLDPIVAYWLLLNYGKEKFPGIEKAGVAVWKAGKTPEKSTLEQWQKDGIISFDIEGGTFDHHGSGNATSLLVAETLGVIENPELQTLLRYIQEDDMAGLHNLFGDLAGVLKAMYKRRDSTEDIIKKTLDVIDALQFKEKSWVVDAKLEFETKAKIFKIKTSGKKIKKAVIQSDNLDVSNYAKQKGGMAIVVQKNSQGYVYIFTNAFFRLNITDIVAAIRIREIELAGKKVRNLNELKKPGKIMDVQHWFFHDKLNAFMNGSAALPETPPTKLSLEEIVDIVIFGLSTDSPESCPGTSKCLKNDCKYYKLLFARCK